MDIRTTTNRLLRDPDVVKWLRIADTHMQAYNRYPEGFVLPQAHALVEPLVKTFAGNGKGFVDYVKAIRDAASDGMRADLQELYRVLSLRYIQQERRNRIRRAVLLIEPSLAKDLGSSPSTEQLLLASRFIEQRWGAMRLEWMAKERKLRKVDKLTTEERALSLEQFWHDIDKSMNSGKVPLGGSSYYTMLLNHLR